MAKLQSWHDEYWLLLMQLYLKKPVGLKPMYARPMVDLALELHFHPKVIYQKMFKLRQLDTPRIEQLWQTYGHHPKKLSREASLLRKMNGFGQPETFYEHVKVTEMEWERDFKPIQPADNEALRDLTPVKLIMILDLYFRLTPITMVPETDEIIALGKLIKVSPQRISDVMEVYQFCDPYLNHDDMMISPLLIPCQEIWQRYGNGDPEQLAAIAAQLKEYFK